MPIFEFLLIVFFLFRMFLKFKNFCFSIAFVVFLFGGNYCFLYL